MLVKVTGNGTLLIVAVMSLMLTGAVPVSISSPNAHGEIEVPGHLFKAPILTFVGVIILPTIVTIAVPVAHRVLAGENPHPLFVVGDGIKHRYIRNRIRVGYGRGIIGLGRTDRVDQGEETRVIGGGITRIHAPFAEHEAVGRDNQGLLS